MSESPDEPVRRIEVEHVDGTVRVLEGKDANQWVQFVGRAMAFASENGGKTPAVEWEQMDDGQ